MNRQFTALSGIAMALIVLNHAIEMGVGYPMELGAASPPVWARNILSVLQSLGVFAVPIFLFISGSFVAYAAKGDPPRLTIKFIYSSLRHLLVPYLIWSLLFFLVIFVHRGDRYSLLEYVKYLIVGYPFHFIPLLVMYYVFSPLLVRIAKRYPLPLIVVIFLYQILLINLVYSGSLGFAFPGWVNVLSPPILRQTLADWGVFFPLGLVYGLHPGSMLPRLRKFAVYFWIITAIFFVVGVAGHFIGINFVIARHICMFTFIFTLPTIPRNAIPLVKSFDRIGRRSYGLYLMHLIVIDLCLLAFSAFLPTLNGFIIILWLLLFALGLIIPLVIMETAAKAPLKSVYRLVFG